MSALTFRSREAVVRGCPHLCACYSGRSGRPSRRSSQTWLLESAASASHRLQGLELVHGPACPLQRGCDVTSNASSSDSLQEFWSPWDRWLCRKAAATLRRLHRSWGEVSRRELSRGPAWLWSGQRCTWASSSGSHCLISTKRLQAQPSSKYRGQHPSFRSQCK